MNLSSQSYAVRQYFGRVNTAMVTPMNADGSVNIDGVQRLADYLVSQQSVDGLVINGTTGESATTSDEEKTRIAQAAIEAVGGRVPVTLGVGSNDTAHTLKLAQTAESIGASGLLVVTPYYNRPPQAGILAHYKAVADATSLPIMLYDIPGRTGLALDPETIVKLAEHPQIVAIKDAKGDLAGTTWVMTRSDIAYYCGEDVLNYPLYALGAAGCVSVVAHVAGSVISEMYDACDGGDLTRARQLHQQLMPAYQGIFRTQGVILTKAALNMRGIPAGPVRLPLVDATEEQRKVLQQDLSRAALAEPLFQSQP